MFRIMLIQNYIDLETYYFVGKILIYSETRVSLEKYTYLL